ncbi:pseudaminic acid cytidylyltransferase [Mesobaculum littorinae]|uniref:Pseudaminic acid cytidylyltransferase n=1 Tax=Mesobaculum littorinae TaxID=2486419 RepID=A0A438AK01_9RHOB|nr:pseudaminic acid cytidylyltransferase [Mesobaculum littorinae]RVV98974.1 pseudaminic acid cytidylyltransferase [Mesobaculum littorinae]
MSVVCVIPARGGSKRIPGKNIRPFAGRPMIDWSIAAAQKAAIFDRILVSTDDEAIAETARRAGSEVPFLRPPELSDDHASTRAVISHAIAQLDPAPRAVCCLYATAPFVRPEDLVLGLRRLDEAGSTADFVVPVTRFAHPIERALRRDPEGRLRMDDPARAATRSQDLPEAFHDAGQFYWGAPAAWTGDAPVFGAGTIALELPRWRVEDIDTEEDWQRAEAMFRALTLDP